MTNGRKRFEHYLKQLEVLVNKASAESDPAIWLYENNARTVLFMLEALSKVYRSLHDENLFKKLQDKFKVIEDGIGGIDHYDCYIKHFSSHTEIPATIISYIQKKKVEAIKKVNHALIKEGWTGKESKRIKKIRVRLDEVMWMAEEDEVNAIRAYYEKEIRKVNQFYNSADKPFTRLEEEVHEIRRKLRWLSIYPQALRGCIQLTDSDTTEEYLKKYLTPEIINSPFNKMPEPNESEYVFLLNKPYFLALSWIISELGELKDKGMTIDVLYEAKSHLPELKGNIEDMIQAVEPNTTIESVLKESSKICAAFFDERNIDKLSHSVVRKTNDLFI